MVSLVSLKWFFLINGSVLLVGTGQYYLLQYFENHLLALISMMFVKNYVSYAVINSATVRRDFITKGERKQRFEIGNFTKTSLIESASYYYASHIAYPTTSILFDIIMLIPMSFLFELVFDFFHYWTHRGAHSNTAFYRIIHSKHHEHSLVSAATTYNHNALDLLLTNFLPVVLATSIVPLSDYTTILVFWYKSIVEVAGHTGKDTSSSFIQCIWLPKALGIELYSRNHNLHHIKSRYNFAKRFSIWDKLFGTYHQGTIYERPV